MCDSVPPLVGVACPRDFSYCLRPALHRRCPFSCSLVSPRRPHTSPAAQEWSRTWWRPSVSGWSWLAQPAGLSVVCSGFRCAGRGWSRKSFGLSRSCGTVSVLQLSTFGARIVGLCYSQNWTTGHPRPLVCAHVLPSYHKEGDNGVDEVCKGQVKGAEDPDTAGGGTRAFKTSLGVCNLGGERG